VITYYNAMCSANSMNHPFLKSKSLWLPTLLCLAFILLYLLLFNVGEAKFYSLFGMLIQWDGQHYLSIARDGYEIFPCPWNPGYICGNIGWFPFYPLVGRLVEQLVGFFGIDIRVTMIAISWLSLWLALLVMYRLVFRWRPC